VTNAVRTKTKINLIKSTFYDEQKTKELLADFIIRSTKLSMGEHCAAFEKAFAAFQCVKFASLFNSGSSANLALIQALLNLGRLKRGDKVAFSSITWSTNVMPLIQLGLIPIPVDIERETLNVGSKTLTGTMHRHSDIKALFISNILGFCSDIDQISSLCSDNNIILLEDNCESFGTVYRGRRLGNYGLASTCSSFVGHHLSTIEGGTVCTDDPELHAMLKMVRAHGWDRSLSDVEQKEMRARLSIDPFYDLYTFYELGYNLRPTEITGFLGILQMEMAETIINLRQKNFSLFHNAAARNPLLLPVKTDHIDIVSNFAYPVVCINVKAFRHLRDKFYSNGVEIRPIVAGNITTQPFFKKYNGNSWLLPAADFIHHHGFYFPNNPELTDEEISRLINLLAG
jgi:CDP-6-deoxy-D-xylo-4-hexulose-3-dehydrase